MTTIFYVDVGHNFDLVKVENVSFIPRQDELIYIHGRSYRVNRVVHFVGDDLVHVEYRSIP